MGEDGAQGVVGIRRARDDAPTEEQGTPEAHGMFGAVRSHGEGIGPPLDLVATRLLLPAKGDRR